MATGNAYISSISSNVQEPRPRTAIERDPTAFYIADDDERIAFRALQERATKNRGHLIIRDNDGKRRGAFLTSAEYGILMAVVKEAGDSARERRAQAKTASRDNISFEDIFGS